ncbi:RidA family protein [Mucilaginibacter sp. 44-25]|uniref:RidA family protein n=1 Tax=Mucilaginibacter sp. 44-25 TaxID=1895794 RepID=UPI000963FDC7|nr:RidA family protein [Mucilaginibacter sp. 44-25]OJW12586.1 MAG: reactive intermediate/imine deaminase [Mucilaginibacter sp. 44-25]HEK21562.1 RidA family protein [Bacteroidota bacterium]
MKTIINTTNAPAPIGPYSQAVAVNGMLFISGQIPMNPATCEIVNTGIADEAKMVMENLKAILSEAGSSFDKVIKSTIFLTDMQTFAQVNEVYGSYFTTDFPARETVQVSALPKGVNVEISVIALKD